MTDFSPYPVKIAAKRVAAAVRAGEIKFDAKGSAETTEFGCIVRIAVAPGCSEPIIRVIDANGRHWFPDVEQAA